MTNWKQTIVSTLRMAQWSKMSCPARLVEYSLIQIWNSWRSTGTNPERHLEKRQVQLKPWRRQTGQRTTTGFVWILPIITFFGKFLSYHFATLETIMSDCIVVANTTQSNRRCSIEKFNEPSSSTQIPLPTAPPRSTFKSIVLVLTVTFSMIVNVGCLAAVA